MAATLQFDAVVSVSQLNKLLDDLRTGADGAAKAINSALGGTVTKKLVLEEVSNGQGTKKLVAVEKERLSVADQLISKQKQLESTQRGSVTSLRQQVNQLKQARDALVRYETSVTSIGAKVRRQSADWAAVNNQLSQVSRQLAVAEASGFWNQIKVATRSQGLINLSNGLVGITQGFQAASILAGQFLGAINSVVDASAKLQSFALAFRAIGAGSAGAVTGLQESSRIALGLGVELNTVIEGFRQLSPVVLNSGGTLGDVSAIVESLSSRFAAFGISGDRARRVMNGVIQAFSKGRLQAEELTQQISEADPAFKTDLAAALLASKDSLGDLGKEIDGTIPNLEKLVKAQKLTSDVLIQVLPRLSKSALLYGKLGSSAGSSVDALERSAVTIDQVRANLANLNQLSLRELALSSTPLINALLRVQAVITDTLSRLSQSGGFDVVASIGGETVATIARLADGLFVLAEGAVGVVSALKPIFDLVGAISQIPGVAQLAGVALLGKFLGPLKLLEGRLASTRAGLQGFRETIGRAFGAPKAAIGQVSAQLKDVDTTLQSGSFSQGIFNQRTLKALRDGSQETATFAQRQRALVASKRLLSAATSDVTQRLFAQTAILRKLESAQAQVALAPLKDKARAAAQARISAQIDNTRDRISQLRAEQGRLTAQAGALNGALKLNSTTATGLGGALTRTGIAIRGVGAGLASLAGAGLGALKGGVKSLLALLDPLLLITLAVGAGTRLYADGTKDATEVTKKFADVNNALSASIKDLAPGQNEVDKKSSALGRTWERLAAVAVRLGDFFASTFEGLAVYFEDATKGVQSFASGFADALGSLGVLFSALGESVAVFTAGAVGALAGLAVAGPIGGVIGALAGVMATLALGTSEAAAAQQQLAKELAAVEAGSTATATEATKLAAAIAAIKPNAETGKVDVGDLGKAREGVDSLRKAQALQRNELDKTAAAYDLNKKSLKETGVEIDKIKAALLEEERVRAGIRESTSPFDEGANQRARESTEETGRLKAALTQAQEKQKQLQVSTKDLANAQKTQNDNLAVTNARTEDASKAFEKLRESNVKTARSTILIGDAIKKLQEENETLELGNPQDEIRLAENLTQIQALQAALERLGKTPTEIKIEVRQKNDEIANAVDGITLDPGPLRETAALVRSTATTLQGASDNFQETAGVWAKRARESAEQAGIGATLTEEAAREFLVKITQSKAQLIDASRQLTKDLVAATNSLDGLTLSNTKFFTQQEINDAAESINSRFDALTLELGITPVITGTTEIERLQEKLSFIETREQAKTLNDTIADISDSLDLVVKALTAIPGVLEILKKNGVDISKISKGAADALNGIDSKELARVGEVFGTIEAGGQKFVQFFDNATGQVETLAEAQFKALEAADRLLSVGGKAGKAVGDGARDARKKVGELKTSIGDVYGSISAGGKEQVIFSNRITGQVESLDKAAFERLKKEQGITAQIEDQNAKLADSLKLSRSAKTSRDASPPQLQDVGGFQVGGGATGLGPDRGGVAFNPGGSQSEDEGNRRMREIAERNGGEYNRVLAEVVASGGEGFMPTARLSGMQADIDRYKVALQTLGLAQNQNTEAQSRYNQALATGSPELLTLAGAAEAAKDALFFANMELEGSLPSYEAAIESARELGISIDSIPVPSQLADTGPAESAEQSWRTYVDSILQGSQEINQNTADPFEGAADGAGDVDQSLGNAVGTSGSIATSLGTAADNAATIAESIKSLQGLTIDVKVNQVPGFFTGGDVTAGQKIRVNELGTEGFLSRGGTMSQINVPANATWRPPSSGTVIPAHLWKQINAPSGKVKASQAGAGSIAPMTRNGELDVSALARRIELSVARGASSGGTGELAAVQAQQAVEIGKLSRAVDRLAAKKWNVQVGVTPDSSTGYLSALNHRL